MLHIGYTGVTATVLPDWLQIRENFMKVVRLSLNYCYLFMMVIIELKVFMPFKLIQVTLLLFTVVHYYVLYYYFSILLLFYYSMMLFMMS